MQYYFYLFTTKSSPSLSLMWVGIVETDPLCFYTLKQTTWISSHGVCLQPFTLLVHVGFFISFWQHIWFSLWTYVSALVRWSGFSIVRIALNRILLLFCFLDADRYRHLFMHMSEGNIKEMQIKNILAYPRTACNAVITIAIRLRYDYDVSRVLFDASKKWTCQFFVVVVS